MQVSSLHKRGFSLFGLCLLLALFRNAIAAPLLHNGTLDTRDGTPITQDEFQTYLMMEYPDTGYYMFYSMGSSDQCTTFREENLDEPYQYFADFFDPDLSEHYTDYFGDRPADVEDQSRAMATVATGTVLIFGAVEAATEAPNSGFIQWEDPILKSRLASGDITALNHMVKDAVQTSDILATEAADGTITYLNGQSGPNASGGPADCSGTHDPPTCDQ